ncbi:ABC transporter permease [Pseudoduganella sp. LjRoot289]|uniref:ABC transporter permease n=1 Tax=Pseudoduganella sp. LjRoot289 TaxID=3342314 RepID=UPI003ED0D7AF
MYLNDLRTGWRLLAQQPAYTAVVVLGLAFGFAASFLLLGYVHYSFSYDSAVPDSRRVYVFKHKLNLLAQPQWTEQMPLPAREVLAASGIPMTLSSVMPRSALVRAPGRNRLQKIELTMVDASFPALFGLRAATGNLDAALRRPDGVALTAGLARQLFGTAPAMGQALEADGKLLHVTALLPDAPPNTTVPYTALIGTGSALWSREEHANSARRWNGLAGKVLVRPGPGVEPETLRQLVQRDADRFLLAMLGQDAVKRLGTVLELRLSPLADAYFDTEVAAFGGGQRAERGLVLALAAVAVLILLLAAVNYVNLATVRTLRRQREIGVRKSLGAGAPRLVSQFMAESVLVSLAATIAGLLLAWLLLPLFSELVERKLGDFFNGWSVLAALALGLLTGVLSGLYPALLALRVRPQQALAGRDGGEHAGAAWLRRGLTTFQFGAAMALTALALAIAWQAGYAARLQPGFDPQGLSLAALPRNAGAGAVQALHEAAARLPGVQGAATSNLAVGAPAIPMSAAFRSAGGREQRINLYESSPEFFDVYGLKPQAGVLLGTGRGAHGQTRDVVINEQAARALGYASAQAAVGQPLAMEGAPELRIAGIAPPLRHQSLRSAVQPAVYMVGTKNAQVLTLRSALDGDALRALLEPLWRRYFPDEVLELRSARSAYEANYVEDWRAAKLLTMSSVLASVIAAFGIYVLAAYSVQRRGREIALRKLHGAGRRAIAVLVGREFVLLSAAAAVLGLPLAGVLIQRYLAGYTVQAPMGAWAVLPLAAAAVLALLVALAASLRHTLSAMRIAPAAALRG